MEMFTYDAVRVLQGNISKTLRQPFPLLRQQLYEDIHRLIVTK